MPEETGSKHSPQIGAILASIYDVNVLETLLPWNRRGSMLVKLAEVLAQCSLLFDAEVLLVSEEYNASRGNQAGKVILLCISQVGEINTVDLSADLGVVVKDIGGRVEKVLECWVAEKALVVVGNFLQGLPYNIRESCAEVLVLVCVVVLLDG